MINGSTGSIVNEDGEFPVCPPHTHTHLGQLVNDHWDESSIDHSLDLLLVPSCDVGQEPDRFLKTKPGPNYQNGPYT